MCLRFRTMHNCLQNHSFVSSFVPCGVWLSVERTSFCWNISLNNFLLFFLLLFFLTLQFAFFRLLPSLYISYGSVSLLIFMRILFLIHSLRLVSDFDSNVRDLSYYAIIPRRSRWKQKNLKDYCKFLQTWYSNLNWMMNMVLKWHTRQFTFYFIYIAHKETEES